jgi:hypothetical protein
MREQTSDSYPQQLLAEWQARREVVNAYHRALRFLVPESGTASQRQREQWRDLNEKLALALRALRLVNDQMRRYEREHAGAGSQ